MRESDAQRNSKGSLTDQVYESIRARILDGTYPDGYSLIETKLAAELSVSRTPVREALRQLELEELAFATPNKGMIVRGVSPQDIRDIFTIRLLLEGQAARWAAERATEAELRHFSDIIQLSAFYTDRQDFPRLAALDTEFHELLYRACKSRELHHTLAQLHRHATTARLSSLSEPHRATGTLAEHRAIAEALLCRDGDQAAALVRAHIENAYKNCFGEEALR